MKNIKRIILGFVACAAFAVTSFGASTPVSAQLPPLPCSDDEFCREGIDICENGACVEGCRDNGNCASGEVCNTTIYRCEPGSVCDAGVLGLQDQQKTVAVIPNSSNVIVGNRIKIRKTGADTPQSYSCSAEAGCTMNYETQIQFTSAACGVGECFVDESTSKSSTFPIQHSHKMDNSQSGKYYISDILGECDSTGDKIVELTKCGCS